MNEISHRNKKFTALFGIRIVAIRTGLISKKLISYSAEGCMKVIQELTFNI